MFNDALLSKWPWKFAAERGSWWRELVNYKYLNQVSCWQTRRTRGGFSMSVWANINKEYDQFWKFVVIDPGHGTQVSFWHDCWIPGTVLVASLLLSLTQKFYFPTLRESMMEKELNSGSMAVSVMPFGVALYT
ncbi:unnamed protein product [Linum tenue]|uniref:Uncharacterized protein n=1 Tax=Linum tenue TaxID=586396 RepID=A0AAV0HVH4_9ROSI|nr:unnamed protein product [Linum tenue]